VLIDTYGRMPEEGLQWLAKPDLLTDDEIVRLCSPSGPVSPMRPCPWS
jgi:hypothetical protein